MNFHQTYDLRTEFIVYSDEMMQEKAVTSFALHDLRRTNMSHEQ